MTQLHLFDDPPRPAAAPPPDQAARDFAVDPANHVVLEASAGTGKTRVLVERYARLIQTGVDPRHILAITFTRKAAAEMRARVLAELRDRAGRGELTAERWRELRERLTDVQISTIDAFCFGLLREFPLEADVDPAFDIADETEMARFTNEALDLTFRAARALVIDDESVRLLFAKVKLPVLRDAIATLLDRRQVALPAVASFVARHGEPLGAADLERRFIARLDQLFAGSPHRRTILEDGPVGAGEFQSLAATLNALDRFAMTTPDRVHRLRRQIERYFLTKDGKPRRRLGDPFKDAFSTRDGKKRHEQALPIVAAELLDELARFDREISVLLARGLLRVLLIANTTYERLLQEHSLLDFAGMLDRAVDLLERQEDFARSRLKLQSRYHHVLVDELQDTSRRQWRLIELLIDAWGEGEGASDAPTSVFVVGDRKQSIYRFRHAEVTILDEAARKIGALRPTRVVTQAISTSFRAVPELLAFVNALSLGTIGPTSLDERFRYEDSDRFPVPSIAPGGRRDGRPVLGLIAEESMAACAAAVAAEVERLLASTVVRDRSGAPRAARPDDVAILFRARAGHQYFERAIEARGIPTYVYKGLGFFDAPEVQDLQALIRYLAQPDSDLRAAELLRSRFVRVSDPGLALLAPGFAAALTETDVECAGLHARLNGIDRALVDEARAAVARWLPLADRLRPSELIDGVMRDTAYAAETTGRRAEQARENIKKMRGLIRRVENRGYVTLDRLAAYFETLRAGDESNALIEAAGSVNLMTIHAAKGLEFPIVFVVNLHAPGRGRPAGFSVIERGPSGEPEVAFATTAATDLEDEREMEELRRLLYVAVTRARDRLYLAAEFGANGSLRRGGRSLASLLPAGLSALFSTRPDEILEVEWTTEHGTFAFTCCRPERAADDDASAKPAAGSDAGETNQTAEAPVADAPTDAGIVGKASHAEIAAPPLLADSRRRVTPAAAPTSNEGHEGSTALTAFVEKRHDERLIGTLAHRLLQRGADPDWTDDQFAREARRLLKPDQLVDVDDVTSLARHTAAVYRKLRAHPTVAAAIRDGHCLFEVPFTYDPADRPEQRLRGVVDCLVTTPDGSATVLEFKTGRPRPAHEMQAELYGKAMAEALGLPRVDVEIIYADIRPNNDGNAG